MHMFLLPRNYLELTLRQHEKVWKHKTTKKRSYKFYIGIAPCNTLATANGHNKGWAPSHEGACSEINKILLKSWLRADSYFYLRITKLSSLTAGSLHSQSLRILGRTRGTGPWSFLSSQPSHYVAITLCWLLLTTFTLLGVVATSQ